MAVLKADTERMSASANKVAATVERVRAEARSLCLDLELLAECWQGEAATSFQAVIAQWNHAEAQVETSLDSIGVALQHASVGYQDVEGRNALLFR
ncbi:WXG100 family type VII secretion target [Sinomonas sp. ASV322]|uniref:WXG100 family type VII secretion target n=1 Tax=Sinomonas sp. ASV322 TaxID=3041920 RepID=UPI0027DDF1BA|nr:WXG100 family type VII secretion target [Sinomonas sp. ASV322]MDQ4503191.1 WXG100 family type VII secretion target [Sinomonas sp. ASV322]